MARSDGKRPDRVGERIREELMGLVLRGAVHDPAVTDVVVSGVKVTEDLSMARVFVRTLHPLDVAGQANVIAGLERATGFLRREVGKALGIRLHPELRFAWDESIDRAISIERLFDEIRTEERGLGSRAETRAETGVPPIASAGPRLVVPPVASAPSKSRSAPSGARAPSRGTGKPSSRRDGRDGGRGR